MEKPGGKKELIIIEILLVDLRQRPGLEKLYFLKINLKEQKLKLRNVFVFVSIFGVFIYFFKGRFKVTLAFTIKACFCFVDAKFFNDFQFVDLVRNSHPRFK